MVDFQLPPSVADIPAAFVQSVRDLWPANRYLSSLLWQRGLRDPVEISGFLRIDHYQPTGPAAFGAEIQWAVERIDRARAHCEKVLIWGDFDADGVTATSVLWDGLRQFLPSECLSFYIPDRLKESHGLNLAGLERSHQQGVTLIITCDTGSTNLTEILAAQQLGIDIIVTDHHTLPSQRPPVIAIINPRALPADHPLYHLAGVAVAYKLVEALYMALPDEPEQPLEYLLDLVAIGLVADLVQLRGDCRYLAQTGIQRLQQQNTNNPNLPGYRPGVAKLLELCRRTGDRPMDISFGIAPRINALSRIYGDASGGVQLLTSRDEALCNELAMATEQANARRKELQKTIVAEVEQKIAALDLSTTSVIVLEDSRWSPGILGLVAGQIAQAYGKPTILLSTAPLPDADPQSPLIARGSARSVSQVDLYQLVQSQAHLLLSFGGHPLAAGLSLRAENLPLFTEAINQQLRQTLGELASPLVAIDLVVPVAELGKILFDELKQLEPCGMGNPVPKLLVRNCHLHNATNHNIQDIKGQKIQYIKTELQITDGSTTELFPVVWWGHYTNEVPDFPCDLVIELDYNNYKNRCEARILELRPAGMPAVSVSPDRPAIVDLRLGVAPDLLFEPMLMVRQCPRSWEEFLAQYTIATAQHQSLALAYNAPECREATTVLQNLLGIVKYLVRTGQPATLEQLQEQLGISARALRYGWDCLEAIGYAVVLYPSKKQVSVSLTNQELVENTLMLMESQNFLDIVTAEIFMAQYFWEVPLPTLLSVV